MQHTRMRISSGGVAMKQRPRIYYSESQKALMWERWRKGDTLHQIARLFNRNHSSVQGILAQTGGIQPAPRRRSSLPQESIRVFVRATLPGILRIAEVDLDVGCHGE